MDGRLFPSTSIRSEWKQHDEITKQNEKVGRPVSRKTSCQNGVKRTRDPLLKPKNRTEGEGESDIPEGGGGGGSRGKPKRERGERSRLEERLRALRHRSHLPTSATRPPQRLLPRLPPTIHALEREGPAGGSRHENAVRSGEAHYVGVCKTRRTVVIYVGATLERGHASPLLLFVARNGSSCHVHKGHVEFYLRQWAKKGDEVGRAIHDQCYAFLANPTASHRRFDMKTTPCVPRVLRYVVDGVCLANAAFIYAGYVCGSSEWIAVWECCMKFLIIGYLLFCADVIWLLFGVSVTSASNGRRETERKGGETSENRKEERNLTGAEVKVSPPYASTPKRKVPDEGEGAAGARSNGETFSRREGEASNKVERCCDDNDDNEKDEKEGSIERAEGGDRRVRKRKRDRLWQRSRRNGKIGKRNGATEE
ncbi:hypothetical protein WN48_08573 [Eufriesea mexicana]|nr:hypothetical protein WN48_08573 [Eufriesea mexicana]